MDSPRFLKGLSMPPLRKGQSANVKECKWDFLGKTGAFKKNFVPPVLPEKFFTLYDFARSGLALMGNQTAIFIQWQYIGNIRGKTKADIFYKTEALYQAVVVSEFGSKAGKVSLLFIIHQLGHE